MPGGFKNVVPSYSAGRGATSAYMVAMLIMLPRPRCFHARANFLHGESRPATPAVRFRIHTSMVP